MTQSSARAGSAGRHSGVARMVEPMRLAAAASLALLLVACGDAPPAAPAAVTAPDVGWQWHGGDLGEARYSELAQIDQDNVAQLGLAWSFELGSVRGVEATPIVRDGVMYVSAPWSIVHALDAKTGKELWRYDPEVPRQWGRYACCDVVNRGVAVVDDSVFIGTLDGRLVAISANDGTEQWAVQTTPRDKAYTITGAPRVANGKVIIGNGGAEYGVRGYITAYDAKTGEQAWRFYTVPGDPSKPLEHPDLEPAMKTWFGEWWEAGGGGTVWDSMAYDEELNLLYVGVGNGSPWTRYARSPGGGDNLYLSSILAINPDTGRLAWHYQTTPGDNWDYTATQHILLTEVEVKGVPRKVLMQAPKNGFLYLLDRASGELIDAKPYVHINWATHVDIETGRPVETPVADYRRSGAPDHSGPAGWAQLAADVLQPALKITVFARPRHGLWYANEQEFKYNPATWNLGLDIEGFIDNTIASPPEFRGHLVAWDPTTMKPVWQKRFDAYYNGGVLSTAGGLVFHGTADGRFNAYRDTDGELLWTSEASTGFMAPAISYRIDGEQYVAVAAGVGGGSIGNVMPGAKINEYLNEGRVLVYKLGASAAMPMSTPRDLTVPQPPRASQARRNWSKPARSCTTLTVVSATGSR